MRVGYYSPWLICFPWSERLDSPVTHAGRGIQNLKTGEVTLTTPICSFLVTHKFGLAIYVINMKCVVVAVSKVGRELQV